MTATDRPPAERAGAAGRDRRLLDPDALAAWEEERDFLLASLEDLEAEWAAGDLDPEDYRTLKDDYTGRAAAAVRRIEDRQQRARDLRRAAPPRRWGRRVLVVAGIVVAGVVAGLVFADAVGRRGDGDEITGQGPTSSRSLLDQGDRALAAGDLAAATEAYDEVLAIDSRNVDALLGKARVALVDGDVDAAVALHDEVLAIEPDHVEALAYQAALFGRQGDPDRALDQLADAIALDPGFLDAWGFRLAIAAEQGRWDETLAAVEALAAGGDADIATAVAQQASSMAMAESSLLTPVQALQVFDAVLAGAPEHPPALTYRAWEPARLVVQGAIGGDDAEEVLLDALARLDQALAVDPTYPDALAFRVIVLKHLGRLDEARDALAAFDAADPPAGMQALVDGIRGDLTE